VTITTEPAPPPDGSPDEPTPAARSRRKLLAVVLVAVVGLAAAGWWLFIRDDDDDASRLPDAASGSVGSIPPAAESVPDAEAQSLQELLEEGRERTFHTTYQATGDPEALGGDLTVEVWRKDGKIRQDTTVVRGSTTVRSSGFVLGDETVTCTKTDDAPWACSSEPDPGTTEDGLFGAVAAELSGADVTETQETVAGREARCFTFPTGDSTGKICVTPEGIPLSLSANGQELVIVDVASDVDDAVFEPPAEP
jgi:hypothetical protein